jgi:NhaP-type Na+/H+ or K+/H+ antiporter/mannitol/fructose-specific phosphotransferase system IIA component (Ntr-type)
MHGQEILSTFTIAAAIGVCLTMVASLLRTSAIVVLLIGGVLVGPQMLGVVKPDVLGDGLGTIISLAVAIILFEGGLTLDLKGYRTVSREIRSILTIGVLVTWLGTTALLKLIFNFDWPFCFLAASLVIVTGPTVIGPLLHRINVTKKLNHILHWEGVLIDPIGVFIALLSYEYYISTAGEHQSPAQDFLLRFTVGAILGIVFGYVLHWVLKRNWVDQGHTNIFVLAMAMLNFAIADLVVAECGLLSVTVAGLVLGSQTVPQLRGIISYKVELKDFLIGLLFILLAANLDLYSFLNFGWGLVLVVIAIMLIVRPLNVFLSLLGSSLNVQEKLFLSWIAPRGIVAASMASVFALELSHHDANKAQFLETFTYSVIAGTVLVQGLSAGSVGRWLGVLQPTPRGWVIVGAHALGRRIAKFMAAQKVDVVLIDTNPREVRAAHREGLTAINADATSINQDDHVELYGCGNLLAITTNQDLNRVVCQRWAEVLDSKRLFRWEKAGGEDDENMRLSSGRVIWRELALSRWMQSDCDTPPIYMRPFDPEGSETDLEDERVLLTYRSDSNFVVGEPENAAVGDQSLVLDLRGNQHLCPVPLVPFNVTQSKQTGLYELYREMLTHLKSQSYNVDPEATLADIWKREEQHTSLLGHGVSLPHYWSPHLQRSVLMVARPEQPVACPTTERPVELVFLLLSPAADPKAHLEHLSYIAQLIGSETRRLRLLQAANTEELYELIVSGH